MNQNRNQDHETVAELRKQLKEMKEVEKTLRERMELLKMMESALESSMNPIALMDLKGHLFYANSAFLNLFGYHEKSEIHEKKASKFWRNEEEALGFIKNLLEKGSFSAEQMVRRKDGTLFPIMFSANIVPNDQGKFLSLMGSSVDMEERIRNANTTAILKDISKAVNTSEGLKELFPLIHRSLGNLMDTRNFFIARYDQKTDTISFPYFCDERETPSQILDALDSGALIAEDIRSGKPRLFTGQQLAERLSPDGQTPSGQPAKVWLTVPLTLRGTVIGALGLKSYDNPEAYSKKDIALLESISEQLALAIDRKRREEALLESESKYRNVLQSVQDGYYELDIHGNFTVFNPSLCRIFGASSGDLMGAQIKGFADRENAQLCAQIFNRVLSSENPVNDFDWTLIRKNGEERQVATSVSLLRDAKGEAIGFQGMIRDITDQRRLEAALQQTQKMEAIGTLAGGIAHNFNNLLMGIQGNISLMLLDTLEGHPFYQRLMTMEKLVQNGSKLTTQLLGYAREGSYQLQPLQINRLVLDTSETFSMTKKEMRIHWNLEENLHEVMADRNQFEQILLNLFINAADAMPKGGDLYLETRNATHMNMQGRAYKPKPGDYVLLSVRDTGIGMDQKTLDRIFDPFFTTKGPSKGTGLGLASVYGIVKSHGGYIDVHSILGEGTTFSIFLPASERKFSRESTRDLLEELNTILLVDDEQIILEIGEEMLRKLGYEVLVAGGGREALEVYREAGDKVDLVILDMIMPDMGGGDVFDKLKKLDPGVKVLLSSGYSIDGQAGEILERGCDGFIQKPFNLKELSTKIREIVDH